MAFTVGSKEDLFSKLKSMVPAKRLDLFSKTRSQGDSSPFSMLTPTQFAELFPKYYLRQKPDVKGFYDALSQKPMSGEGTYGPHGEAGSSTVSTGAKVTNVVRAKEIYDYIRSKGIDHNHAVGIVNNMKYESGFDSGAMGDHMTSGGLFQHHASRFTAMKNYVGDGWQTNWKKQIDFALTESEMKTYLAKNFASPVDASREFTLGFERPANKEQQAAARASTAEGYASAVTGNAGEPGGGATTGGNYEINSSGFLVPKNKTLYDPGNEEECATLVKSMNPDVGRSSSWTVLPNASLIRPGVAVATTRYNLEGGDRRGSGYHSGIAMSSPDEQGNFMLLEQSAGRPPRLREVNAFKYDGGALGGTTQFGVISSNGRIHDEQSMEALNYGAKLAPNEEVKRMILSNQEAVAKGQLSGSDTGGQASVSVNSDAQSSSDTPGPQTNLEQESAVNNIQTATIGDMMRFVGNLAGFFSRGEGIGDATPAEDTGITGDLQFATGPEASFQRNSEVLIRRLMKDYNISSMQAAGIVGNLASESHGKEGPLTAGQKERGGGGLGWGQWTGDRRKDFVKFAREYGKEHNITNPVAHPEINYQFLKKEFDTTHKHVIDNIRNTRTLEEATYQGLNYERPGWSLNTTVTKDRSGRKHTQQHFKSFETISANKSEGSGLWKDRMKYAQQSSGFYDVAERQKSEATKLAAEQQKPAAAPETLTAKIGKAIIGDYGAETLASDKFRPTHQHESTATVFERMRKMKASAVPEQQNIPKGAVDFAPAPVQEPVIEPPKSAGDKQTMNMNQLPPDPAPKPVSFDGLSDGYYKSPSLARAMQNLTDTNGASDGHFGGTSLV